jgi:hypothetical protein
VTDGNVEFVEVVVSMVVGTAMVAAVLYGDERRREASGAKRRKPNDRGARGVPLERKASGAKRRKPNDRGARGGIPLEHGEHAWLPATRDAAILGTFLFGWLYGCPALLIHFVKSRWSPAGWGIGLLWSVLLFAAVVGAALAVELTVDLLAL